MTCIKNPACLLLLTTLLITGVSCKKDAVFVYSRLGGQALLPCTRMVSSGCSLISWSFYKGGNVRFTYEVKDGRMNAESDKSSRMSITSNCSLQLHDLRVDDAGSYVCLNQGSAITDVYLSLITITSLSKLTDLQPGGNLSLSCILFTYYDAGSCKSYSTALSLSWMAEDGTPLPTDGRYEITGATRCNVTLVTELQSEDSNRRWRCQVGTAANSREVFQDFTSIFLFQDPPPLHNLISSPAVDCPAHLPVSRIVLCVALPVMVAIVGIFTWRTDRKHLAKTSAAPIEPQDVSC